MRACGCSAVGSALPSHRRSHPQGLGTDHPRTAPETRASRSGRPPAKRRRPRKNTPETPRPLPGAEGPQSPMREWNTLGRLDQLVDRLLHTEEVVGSSPASPTAREPLATARGSRVPTRRVPLPAEAVPVAVQRPPPHRAGTRRRAEPVARLRERGPRCCRRRSPRRPAGSARAGCRRPLRASARRRGRGGRSPTVGSASTRSPRPAPRRHRAGTLPLSRTRTRQPHRDRQDRDTGHPEREGRTRPERRRGNSGHTARLSALCVGPTRLPGAGSRRRGELMRLRR